jgi:hypothetical protein
MIRFIVRTLNTMYEAAATRLAEAESRDGLIVLAAAMLAVSSFISWFVTPLQGDIRGLSFPLLGEVHLSDGLAFRFRLFSFGTASLFLSLITLLAYRFKLPKRTFLFLGSGAVLLSAFFIGHLFLVRAGLLESGMDQLRQAENMAGFSTTYMAGNSVVDPGWADQTTNSLTGRMKLAYFQTGFTEMGIGWWWVLVSGLLLVWAAVGRPNRWAAARDWGLVFVIVIGLLAGIGWKPVRGEQYRLLGDRLVSAGLYDASIEAYRKAAGWQPFLNENPDFVHNLGMAYFLSGQIHEPEADVFAGDNHAGRMENLEALQAYRKAFSVRPDSSLIRGKIGDLLVTMGLSDYATLNPHSAIARWRRALEVDPGRIDAHLFLGYAYFRVNKGGQAEAIRENEIALRNLANKLFVSDVYNNLGDCYYKSGDYLQARTMYTHSFLEFKLVKKVINFNAQKGLQGL